MNGEPLTGQHLTDRNLSGHHLSDEQFAELLAGELADPAAQAHLAACLGCRRETAVVRSATAEFNQWGLEWARAEAAHRVATPSRFALYLGGRPAWGVGLVAAATACLVVVGLHLPNGHRHGDGPAQMATVAVVEAMPSNAELVEDNHLLRSIDQELRYDASPVIAPLDLRGPRHDAQRTAPQEQF